MDFLIITGLSGAGKSLVMDALEDIGYFCVDNVPPALLSKFVKLNEDSSGDTKQMAVAIDTRSRKAFYDLAAELDNLDKEKKQYKILFVDANDYTIFNRYKENRRKHPLMNETEYTLEVAIDKERDILDSVRQRADYYIDTTHLAVRQLKDQIVQQFSNDFNGTMAIQLMSFGFKRGLPMDADMVFDLRSLPNPYYNKELRPLSGLDSDVRDYVMEAKESKTYLAKIIDMLDFLQPLFLKEGRSRMVVAIGCTGGMHRSVAFIHAVAEHFREKDIPVIEMHRDMGKSKG